VATILRLLARQDTQAAIRRLIDGDAEFKTYAESSVFPDHPFRGPTNPSKDRRRDGTNSADSNLSIQRQAPRIEKQRYSMSFPLVVPVFLEVHDLRTNVERLETCRSVSPNGVVRMLEDYSYAVSQAPSPERACAKK
jgi:hypothetical protein